MGLTVGVEVGVHFDFPLVTCKDMCFSLIMKGDPTPLSATFCVCLLVLHKRNRSSCVCPTAVGGNSKYLSLSINPPSEMEEDDFCDFSSANAEMTADDVLMSSAGVYVFLFSLSAVDAKIVVAG